MERPADGSSKQFDAASPAALHGTSSSPQQPSQTHETEPLQQSLQQQQLQMQQLQRQDRSQQRQQLFSDLVAGIVTSGIYTSLTYPVHR